jgi:hypothetical protein
MTRSTLSLLLVAAAVVFPAQTGAGQSTPAPRFGIPGHPLEGRRYETMRALAHLLAERADRAAEALRRGAPERKELWKAAADFARRADSFHDRMDRYLDAPWIVPEAVRDLERRARKIQERIGRTHAADKIQSDWNAAIDALRLMKKVLAGEQVEVPPATPGWGDYARDYAPFTPRAPTPLPGVYRSSADATDSYRGGGDYVLAGEHLEEFRRLAGELQERMTRALADAGRDRVDDSGRADQLITEMRQFQKKTNELETRAHAARIDLRQIGPLVRQLLAEARQADRDLREARFFPQISEEWPRVIELLERMAALARS